MLDKIIKIVLLFSVITAASFKAGAQPLSDNDGPKSTKENSPYSRYGIGNLNNGGGASMLAIGSASTAYIDPFSNNSYNPASYSFLNATALDFGFQGSSNSVFMDNKTYASGTITFSYLTLGVPLNKNSGLVFGFKPISTMYYNATDTAAIDNLGLSTMNYTGSGGVQYAYVGASGKYKGFSVGFNLGYTFGRLDYTNSFSALSTDSAYAYSRNGEFNYRDQIGGLYWKGGLMYQAAFEKEHFLNIGATVTLSQALNVKRDAFNIAYTAAGGELISADTLYHIEGEKGSLQMPSEYSFGVFYGKTFNWAVGADFIYTDWSGFHKMEDRIGISNTAYRMSIGGEFTPDPKAGTKKYLSIVTYRLGAYYGKENLHVNNTDIDYMGATIGASFPMKRQFTQFGRIHTTLDLGKRGTTVNGLAREFFVKFTFGVSLNDVWFIRPKYN